MSRQTQIRDNLAPSTVHYSQYLRTENGSDGEEKPADATQPESPKAE